MNKINLSELKKHQEFYEYKNNRNYKMVALDDAKPTTRGMTDGYFLPVSFTFAGTTEKMELFEAETPGNERLNLYDSPYK